LENKGKVWGQLVPENEEEIVKKEKDLRDEKGVVKCGW